ncbi:glutathione S-transferase family protein [Bradyrhizobium sp. USDA 3256]
MIEAAYSVSTAVKHKLFYSPGSCSMAAHIVLEEIGEPYEYQLVSASGPKEGEMTGSPEWKAVNPKGRVPALSGVPGRIGGADNLLTEGHAIMIYLARTNPSADLLPTEPAAEARCIEWMNWLASNVHAMSYGLIWRPHRFSHDESLFPALRLRGKENVISQYAYIESLLSDGRQWSIPEGYTVVDPYLFVFYYWGARIDLDMSRLYPAWTSLMQRVLARPAVKRMMAIEGVQLTP